MLDITIKKIRKLHQILDFHIQELNIKEIEETLHELGNIQKTEKYYVGYSNLKYLQKEYKEGLIYIKEGLKKFSYSFDLYYNAIIINFHLKNFEEVFNCLGYALKYSNSLQSDEIVNLSKSLEEVILTDNLLSKDEFISKLDHSLKIGKSTNGKPYPFNKFGESIIRKVQDEHTNYENLTNLYKTVQVEDLPEKYRIYMKSERYEGKKGTYFSYHLRNTHYIPISLIEKGTTMKFFHNNEEIKVDSFSIKYNQFNILKFPKGELKILSDKPIFVGNMIKAIDEKKKYKLILHIFIDGLSQEFLNSSSGNLLNKIENSFNNIYKNQNCYANADWTFPSVASTVTSTYIDRHGQYHPIFENDFSENTQSLIELIKNAGYYSTLISGCWRTDPIQGYGKSYDRVVFKNSIGGFGIGEITDEVIDHLDSFPNKNHYIWITLPELHDVADELYYTPASQINISAEDRLHSKVGVTSIQTGYSQSKIKRYEQEIKRLDKRISDLFLLLKERYEEDEMLVIIHSDHGQTYLTPPTKHNLNDYKTKVAFYLLGGNIHSKISNELMSNVDIYPTILDLLNIPLNHTIEGICLKDFGGIGREYSITETYHPNQPYQIVFHFKKFKIYFETQALVDSTGSIDFTNYSFDTDAPEKNEAVLKGYEIAEEWITAKRLYLQS